PLLTDCEFPEVVIEPPHDDLDDVVQDLERDRGRHLDLTPDQGIGVPQLDANGGDLVEAVGCGVLPGRTHHAASLAGWAFQFQGSAYWGLWMLWSLMRASTSASHACGSTPLSRAVWISVYMTAARSPPRSEPANSHDLRPSAMPRSSRSAALLVRQI